MSSHAKAGEQCRTRLIKYASCDASKPVLASATRRDDRA
jgi:hypothetical protein